MINSDHAVNKATRSSQTGFLVYINIIFITWFSKKQPTIESFLLMFGFVAMKTVMESLRGLR